MKKPRLKRIVVKVGTSLLTTKENRLDGDCLKEISSQICRLLKDGKEVILVTSGAIGAGMSLLKITERPLRLQKLQACAAIGQSELMKIYAEYFKKRNRLVAQVLLTREDLADRGRYLNTKNTLEVLLGQGVVPIINENDTVSTEEIKFGDNDKLSSLVANLVKADLLIMLSNVDGLHRCDYRKQKLGSRIKLVTKITDDIKRMVLKAKTKLGVGGMASKIEAAELCINSGIPCVIANGRTDDILFRILDGEDVGTSFLPARSRITAKKHWMAYSSKPKGRIIVDDGAKEALISRNKSLLSSGIIGQEGDFVAGDIVSIAGRTNKEFARGRVNYSSVEVKKISGLKTCEIEKALGRKSCAEVIHRDNLAII